ncbi:MAG: hypothetical protein KGL43_21310 [Burkholderiales bacterium]|nr:hypothetical protein [Burkholderiales bacterium]MDE2398504.1 hypothetical protein [Burkholderiales bacterium]MDE2456133.1 hypothetical protein [Burkholderiales bacterium]
MTESLARRLGAVDPAGAELLTLERGATDLLADLITRQLSALLDEVAGDDAARRQLELVNGLLFRCPRRPAASFPCRICVPRARP